MKIKERMKNVGFWVSLISALFLILGAFGVEVGDDVASTVINAEKDPGRYSRSRRDRHR